MNIHRRRVYYLLGLALFFLWSPHESLAQQPEEASSLFRGVARFASGSQVDDAELEFRRLTDDSAQENQVPSRVQIARCKTDANGQFEINLSDLDGRVDLVVATKWEDGSRRIWRIAESISLEPGETADRANFLDLVFEDRGRVTVRFFGTDNLTSETSINLSLDSVRREDFIGLRWNLPANTRGLTIDRLEPGEYTVQVGTPKVSPTTWLENVTIGDDQEVSAVVPIQFPKVDFGTLTGQVFLPDGTTPAAGMQISITNFTAEAEFARDVITTDPRGRFQTRCPVGNVRIGYSPWRGAKGFAEYAATSLQAEVVAETETDIGDLRIQHLDEVTGLVEGSLKTSSGAAVEYVVMGALADLTPGPCLSSGYRPEKAFDVRSTGHGLMANGAFAGIAGPALGQNEISAQNKGSLKFRVQAGKSMVQLGLDGTGKMHGGFIIGRNEKHLLLPVEVVAGERYKMDVVIPDGSASRTISIRALAEPQAFEAMTVSVTVLLDGGILWRTERSLDDAPLELEGVPEGRCFVAIGKFWNDNSIWMQQGSADQNEFEFDLHSNGELLIGFENPARESAALSTLELSLDTPLGSHSILKLNGPEWTTAYKTSHSIKSDPDGSLLISGIAPGRYRVRGEYNGQAFDIRCRVVQDQVTQVIP